MSDWDLSAIAASSGQRMKEISGGSLSRLLLLGNRSISGHLLFIRSLTFARNWIFRIAVDFSLFSLSSIVK